MTAADGSRRVLIMGAAGRDFHNFNVVYRNDPSVSVVAFTAAQIPGIAGRRYPSPLAGSLYPDGIPILDESELPDIVRTHAIDEVVFAYSDVEHADVMHRASIALAAGADFTLLGPRRTMLQSALPVISVCAVRTGVGKSQVSRWLSGRLRAHGLRVAVLRHPMPYGDLSRQVVQRFASASDLDAARCTLEEREEYEPHLATGTTVFAGIDYARILEAAQREADILLWDGGNNDFPFVRPDLAIVLVDPLRPGHETAYHPGETVLRMADIVVVAKSNTVGETVREAMRTSAAALAPDAAIVLGASTIAVEADGMLAGKRVIVVDDGPTLTHGGMAYGAGYVAALQAGATEIVDPRRSAVGEVASAYARFPHMGRALPALGYSPAELADLEATIAASAAEVVVSGTPVDLAALIDPGLPIVRVRYEYADQSEPTLWGHIRSFLQRSGML